MEEIIISIKYLDFANVFSSNSVAELPEHTGINNCFINLIKGQQLPYGPIYSLELVKLKTLKTYIKINFTNSFIRLLKSPANALILFVHMKNGSFWLCVNYQRLNNLIIRNRYPLSLIGELLN